jgi:phenylpyruvate tautomerase PptA (4-oxalocrotonate tautomerase family)
VRKDFSLLGVMVLPVVQVNVWSGISLENKKKVVEEITGVLEE